MRFHSFRLALPLALPMALAAIALPAAASAEPLHSVANVDLMPVDQDAGTALLARFAARAALDPAVRTIRLVRQDGTPNHLILDTLFVSRDAYRHFVQSPYVRQFRSAIYPDLGSPWDERLGVDIVPPPGGSAGAHR